MSGSGFFFLYLVLLLLWPALLWPAWRLRGAARAGLLAVALTGAAAASWEVWVTFIQTPPANIRLDILPIAFVLLVAYAVAAAILWRAGPPWSPAAWKSAHACCRLGLAADPIHARQGASGMKTLIVPEGERRRILHLVFDHIPQLVRFAAVTIVLFPAP